jgi:hypothetical protein
MKKHIKQLSYLLLPFILSLPLATGFARSVVTNGKNPSIHRGYDDEVTKRKVINKSYTVKADDKLDIDNEFGSVVVSTWDKDQITVDIEIETKASTDEKATKILNQIDVKESQKDKTISLKTQISFMQNGDHGDETQNADNDDNRKDNNDRRKDNDDKQKDKDRKQSSNRRFTINYVVHMPAANPLRLENKFGKIVLPDLQGPVHLVSKFGSLTTGKLGNVESVDVEFGSATIAEIGNGKLTLKFDGRSEIRKIGGNVKIGIEFSGPVQLGLGDDLSDLALSESYSEVRMIANKDLSAEFSIHTSFGNFRDETGANLQEKKASDSDVGPHFDKDFKGMTGDGKAKITIKSSFGNILLTHDWHGTTT